MATIDVSGADALTTSPTFVSAAKLGLSTISGSAAIDKLRLSAAGGSSHSALIAGGVLKPCSANATITIDADDAITLTIVQASSQFAFA